MGKISRAVKNITENPRKAIDYLSYLGLLNGLSDEQAVKLMWWVKTGKKLDLNNPRGFNEKLQWLKLYDRDPEYSKMVDKYLVKEYVAEKIGREHIIPTYGVWDNASEIDFESLPDQFVLKCTQNSGGGMCVCPDKAALNKEKAVKDLNRALKNDLSRVTREWPYKNVKPRVIAEEYVVDHDENNTYGSLIDYKFHCFNGEPKFLYISTCDISEGRKGVVNMSFVDTDWNPTPFYRTDHAPVTITVKKPERFGEMKAIAEELSRGIPFVRVDMYSVNDRILFSEMTFTPGAGYGFFSPPEWEEKMGDWIVLPKNG